MKPETIMTTNSHTTATRAATSPNWKSVKLCLARPDGSAEIHHNDGSVESIWSDGRSHRPSKSGGSRKTVSVTDAVSTVTPTIQKEVAIMHD
jgi:hypothetical protein